MDVERVDCRDDGETWFCKLYSGYPSDETFIDERDVELVEADTVNELNTTPSAGEPHQYPSEMGSMQFEVPEGHSCVFSEEKHVYEPTMEGGFIRKNSRLTCGDWL